MYVVVPLSSPRRTRGRRHELEGPTGGGVDATRTVGERAANGGPDGPEAKEPDAERLRAHQRGRPHTMCATSAARTRSMPCAAKMPRASCSKASARSRRVTRERELVLASIAR